MMKKFAVLLMTAVLSGLLLCGSLYAAETSSAEDTQVQPAETERTETEPEAGEIAPVPENRPDFITGFITVADETKNTVFQHKQPPFIFHLWNIL